ncbi:hypothetical protein BC829DRAFT_401410 [Chytridium lagenaria]|nr:hypothetical protein BC829DRAFT_401410 [Chytridium lagenaria]
MLPSIQAKKDIVDLHVQGTVFRLSREFILKHDWMPARLLANEPDEPREIYLDVDPTCFRLILQVLRDGSIGENSVKHLSSLDVASLLMTAEYLACEEAKVVLEEVLKGRKTLEEEVLQYKKLGQWQKVLDRLANVPLVRLHCKSGQRKIGCRDARLVLMLGEAVPGDFIRGPHSQVCSWGLATGT